jgi:hypothetical protein
MAGNKKQSFYKALIFILGLFLGYQLHTCKITPGPERIKIVVQRDTITQKITTVSKDARKPSGFRSVFVGSGASIDSITTIITAPCIPDSVTTIINNQDTIYYQHAEKRETAFKLHIGALATPQQFGPGIVASYKRMMLGAFITPFTPSQPWCIIAGYKIQFGNKK